MPLTQGKIFQAHPYLNDERVRDLILVVRMTEEAKREDRPMDDAFEMMLAQERQRQASGYEYPLPDTGPTLESSLLIVRDIGLIRRLTDAGASGELETAEQHEWEHRLQEKGLLGMTDVQLIEAA